MRRDTVQNSNVGKHHGDLKALALTQPLNQPLLLSLTAYRLRRATHRPALPVPALVQVAAQAEVAGV